MSNKSNLYQWSTTIIKTRDQLSEKVKVLASCSVVSDSLQPRGL